MIKIRYEAFENEITKIARSFGSITETVASVIAKADPQVSRKLNFIPQTTSKINKLLRISAHGARGSYLDKLKPKFGATQELFHKKI